MEVTGVTYARAERLLAEARGHVKTALVMELRHVDYATARRLLREARGFVYRAIRED